LVERVAAIIENRKYRAYARLNIKNALVFWEIGEYVNAVILSNRHADYGKIESGSFHRMVTASIR
jgi:hypothetical protein